MGRRTTIAAVAAALFGLAAVAAVAAPGWSGGTPAAASFRLEDGSAGCNFRASGEIACRATGRGGAAVLEPGGASRVDPGEIVAWDETTPVLLAAESWWNGEVSCRVSGPRILCRAGEGSIAVGG